MIQAIDSREIHLLIGSYHVNSSLAARILIIWSQTLFSCNP